MSEPPPFTIFGQPVRGRSCGGCTACCTAVPVQLHDKHKPANEKCQHLRGRGCSIYATRPHPCAAWSCRWLFDELTSDMRRPDHAGYIIDPMLDTILADGRPVEAIQVWVDPKRRDAHKDPALRTYLAEIARVHGIPAIIRWGSHEGMMLSAPCLNVDDEWFEHHSGLTSHEDMAAQLVKAEAAGHAAPQMRLKATFVEDAP